MEEVALAWGPSECEFWAAGFRMASENETISPNLLFFPLRFSGVGDTFISSMSGSGGRSSERGALRVSKEEHS